MNQTEPRNPFYFLLLIASLLFAITAVAYAVLPTLEQHAADVGHPPAPSAFRAALRTDGWRWLLYELIPVGLFAFLSMALDRQRCLKSERASATIAPERHESPTV